MTLRQVLPIAVVLAVLQVACGQEPLPPMRIGTFPGPSNELAFLAEHRGWLSPSTFRLVEFINDGEVMRAFRNGSIEAAFITVDEVLALAQTGIDPVILLVSAESRGADAVMGRSDVTSLPDLRGRRVAVQVNSVSAYLLRRALEAGDLDVKDIQIVNLPPDRHRAAFAKHDVDAVVTSEPVRSQIESDGGVELFSSRSLPLELVAVLIVRGDYLEQHSDRTESLCRAWRQAEGEIQASASAKEWVANHMKVTPANLAGMFDTVRLISPSESQALLGAPRPRLLATTARIQTVLVESGALPAPIALDPIFRWPAGIDQSACRG